MAVYVRAVMTSFTREGSLARVTAWSPTILVRSKFSIELSPKSLLVELGGLAGQMLSKRWI